MDREQLMSFHEKLIQYKHANELSHYGRYVLEMFAAVMALVTMIDGDYHFCVILFLSISFAGENYIREYTWMKTGEKNVRIVDSIRYLPVNWQEYFRLHLKLLTEFYGKMTCLVTVMGISGYCAFHREFHMEMVLWILVELSGAAVIILGMGLWDMWMEIKESGSGVPMRKVLFSAKGREEV